MRVTAEQVAGVVLVESGDDVSPFIAAANALVTEYCADHYDAARLELIELWLSAHFYRVFRPETASETIGPLSESFRSGLLRTGLSSTSHGQQALRFDTAGRLSRADAAQDQGRVVKAGILVV